MNYISPILGMIAGAAMGILFGTSPVGIAVFGLLGLAGGNVAGWVPKGSERIYWVFVILTALMIALILFGVNLPRLIVIAPLVFTAGYFVSRLAQRFTGQRGRLPTR